MKICFASHNPNKLYEIQSVLPKHIEIMSLTSLGVFEEIQETADTIKGNSLIKASFLYDMLQIPVIADDSGLEVGALGGEPGVQSARYASEDKNDDVNIALLLKNLNQKVDRTAIFKTVITYMYTNEAHQFTGITNGKISEERKGTNGFGYDPVFVPEGSDKTFAEMDLEEKNAFSHRKKALDKFLMYVNEILP